jgi:hypothetical protein
MSTQVNITRSTLISQHENYLPKVNAISTIQLRCRFAQLNYGLSHSSLDRKEARLETQVKIKIEVHLGWP